MTREQAKEFMWLENNKNPSVIKWQHHKTIRELVENLIDQIYNEHEAQLKEAKFAITVLNKILELNSELLKAKDEEIERLEALVDEANKFEEAHVKE